MRSHEQSAPWKDVEELMNKNCLTLGVVKTIDNPSEHHTNQLSWLLVHSNFLLFTRMQWMVTPWGCYFCTIFIIDSVYLISLIPWCFHY